LHNFFEDLAAEKEVVKLVLLLSGSLYGAKAEVEEYLTTFMRFSFLWEKNLQQEYTTFLKRDPSLEDFDDELCKYLDIEEELSKRVSDVKVIGVLSIHTTQIKDSLRVYCTMWKNQYTENLLEMARKDLHELVEYMSSTSRKFNMQVMPFEEREYT